MAGGGGTVRPLLHRDGPRLARIDDGHTQDNAGRQCWCNPADLGGDNFGDAGDSGCGKLFGKGVAHAHCQLWIKLVIDKAVDLENAPTQVTPFRADALH